MNDVCIDFTVSRLNGFAVFFVKTSKLDRKISYRIQIRTIQVQSDDIAGYYQILENSLRVDWRYNAISLEIFIQWSLPYLTYLFDRNG